MEILRGTAMRPPCYKIMSHHVDVHQLHSPAGLSYLNVGCESGHIGVNTNTSGHPTYLTRCGLTFWFIQFDNAAYATEWLDEAVARPGLFDWIMRVDTIMPPTEKKA